MGAIQFIMVIVVLWTMTMIILAAFAEEFFEAYRERTEALRINDFDDESEEGE